MNQARSKLSSAISEREELYHADLSELNNIKFTSREIDVIACVIYNRTNKKIASILSISNRTVDAHIYNITSKLNSNSRDEIITFIEKSGKLLFIRRYYIYLLIHSCFEKYLKKVANMNTQHLAYSINNLDSLLKDETLMHKKLELLKRDLKLANIHLNSNTNIEPRLYIYTSANIHDKLSDKLIALIFDDNIDLEKIHSHKLINFTKGQNYYFSIFELLEYIIPTKAIIAVKEEFKKEYDAILNNLDNEEHINSQVENLLQPQSRKLFSGIFLICLILIIFVLYKFLSLHYQKEEVVDFISLKNRVQEAAEYYNTDQTTTQLVKKNSKNILTLQKDIDYLSKHPDYLHEDDLLQSKFAYLSCMLSSHYRWNKNIDMPINQYLSLEYKECAEFSKTNEKEKFYNCVSSAITERVVEYYGNRYKFKAQDPIKSIQHKLEREHYAWEDFILISYYRARGYFPLSYWKSEDIEYVNKYLDIVISSGVLNNNNNKNEALVEVYLAKKYKQILKRKELEDNIKALEQKIYRNFTAITNESNIIDLITLIKLDPQKLEKLKIIFNFSKDDLEARLNELKKINKVFLELLNDGNKYINHYKPWFIDDIAYKKEIIIPNENKFNISTTCGEIMLTYALTALYNSLLYNTYPDPQKLYIENEAILLNSIEVLNKFINENLKYDWKDIGINYTKQKIKQALEILKSADYGDGKLNTKLQTILDKMLEDKFNDSIIDDTSEILIYLKKR